MFYLGRLLALVSIATAANVPSTDAEIYHRFQTVGLVKRLVAFYRESDRV
jgi:hypothetical protein